MVSVMIRSPTPSRWNCSKIWSCNTSRTWCVSGVDEGLSDVLCAFQTLQATEIGSNKQGRIVVNDILYLLRHDPRKYARVKELLSMNEELKRARKAFDEPAKDFE